MYGSTLETAHEEIQKKQPPTYSLVVTPPSRLYETICIHLPGLRISGVHLQTVQPVSYTHLTLPTTAEV